MEKIHDIEESGNVVESTKYIKEQMIKIVLQEINSKKRWLRILDSGCGTGRDIIEIRKRAKQVDVYGEDVHIKRNVKYKGCAFRKCDIEKTVSGKYDIIISSEVIHCLIKKNVDEYLTNLNKMLNSNGMLVITTFNREYLWKMIYRLFKKGESWYHSTHIIFTPKELKNILEKRGFKVEKIVGGRLIHGDHLLNKIDFLPKTFTKVRHNFLIVARKVD